MQCAIDFIKSHFRNNHKLGLTKECPFRKAVNWRSTHEVSYTAEHLHPLTMCIALSFDMPVRGSGISSWSLCRWVQLWTCGGLPGWCVYCSILHAAAGLNSNSSLDTRVTALAWSSFCLLRKRLVRWVNVMCQIMASCYLVPKLQCSCPFSTTSSL